MIASNRTLENGSVRISTAREVIDPDQDSGTLGAVNGLLGVLPADKDLGELGALGTVKVKGLESWSSAGTGLESDDVDTVGSLFNYYLDDNWSVEFKAGMPPKVDIMAKGQVFAPLKKLYQSRCFFFILN